MHDRLVRSVYAFTVTVDWDLPTCRSKDTTYHTPYRTVVEGGTISTGLGLGGGLLLLLFQVHNTSNILDPFRKRIKALQQQNCHRQTKKH